MTSLKAKIGGYVVTVCTHSAPHLDEILALLLAMQFATADWVKLHCHNLTLHLGVGGGEFDEHPDLRTGTDRKPDETCALLVAKTLGVEHHPAVARILAYAKVQDLTGQAVPDDFARLIKTWHLVNKARGLRHDEEVIRWALIGLKALIRAEVTRQSFQSHVPAAQVGPVLAERDRILGSPFRLATMFPIVRQYLGQAAQADEWERQACQVGVEDRQWFERALDEIKTSAQVQIVEHGSEKVKLCIITSANPFIGRAYRSVEAGDKRSDALLQFDTNGQVFITTATRANLRLTRVAALLRNAIIGAKIKRGQLSRDHDRSRERLFSEGKMPGAEEMYYFPQGRTIMNGAVTNPDVEPLTGRGRLMDSRLVTRIVVEGIRRELEHVPVDKRRGERPQGGGKERGSKA